MITKLYLDAARGASVVWRRQSAGKTRGTIPNRNTGCRFDLLAVLSYGLADFRLQVMDKESGFGNLYRPSHPRYSQSMAIFGTKRARKMVTIHNLSEMKAAVQENDGQTKLLVLGLGEAIVTTCAIAKAFLGNSASPGDDSRDDS